MMMVELLKKCRESKIFWLLSAITTGVVATHIFLLGLNFSWSVISSMATVSSSSSQNKIPATDVFLKGQNTKEDFLGELSYVAAKPKHNVGDELRVDINNKRVDFYKNGNHVYSAQIKRVAEQISPWYPISGEYFEPTKEKKHVSAISGLVFPDTIFWGANAFIHGPSTGLSSLSARIQKEASNKVSIELGAEDAAALFDLVSEDDTVEVYSPNVASKRPFVYGVQDPVLKKKDISLRIKSYSYLVSDLDTGEVLYSKNAGKVIPIASVSKLITALVASEKIKPTEQIIISKKAVATEGRQGRLLSSDAFLFSDLIYALLLESSNDAAEAIAEHVGRELFIIDLNKKIGALGLSNTKFSDPSGLSAKNISTANDLTKLLKFLYTSDSPILQITKETSHSAQSYAALGGRKIIWNNLDRQVKIKNPYFAGGKDGYTLEAGQTFAGILSIPISESKGKNFAVIVLRSSDRAGDLQKIAANILNSYVYPDGTTLGAANAMVGKMGKSTETSSDSTSLLFVGDIMMARSVRDVVDKYGKGDYSFLFSKVPFLKKADITFANLEGPISDVGYDLGNLYSFRMSPQVIMGLKSGGIDVVSIANNHMGDFGMAAFEDTMPRLASAEITFVGGGKNYNDASAMKVVERHGIKVGYLAFSDVGPAWMSKDRELPYVMSASDPKIFDIIKNASGEVDHLVVSFHFGDEYDAAPSERQITLAHASIDAGADIVIGHHPHVVQRVEKYKDGIIAYSLGNFIFDQGFSEETMTGGVLEIVIDGDGNIGSTNFGLVRLNNLYQPKLIEK
ncbi:MAG: CapA family protein [Candidatus Paceibacterota bacterium]|jgi:D-alanyl-D-alanine carboxypeptidase